MSANGIQVLNAPKLVWEKGPLRIVAVQRECDGGHTVSMLLLEVRERDLLGQERWVGPEMHTPEMVMVLDMLLTEIASTIEVLPAWVREFVKNDSSMTAERDTIDSDFDDEASGDVS